MRKSQKKRIWAILGMFALVAVYHYVTHRVPQVESGVERTETDSTIVENSVQVSLDSAGNKAYENVRPVTSKTARPKGMEIPTYLTDSAEETVQHEGFTLSYNKKHLLHN